MSKVQMRNINLIPTGGISYKDYMKLFEGQRTDEIISVDAVGEFPDSENGFGVHVNSLRTRFDSSLTLTTSGHFLTKNGCSFENGFQALPSKDTIYLYTFGNEEFNHMFILIHPKDEDPIKAREEGLTFHRQTIEAYLEAVEKGEVKPTGVALKRLVQLAMELTDKEPSKITRVLDA